MTYRLRHGLVAALGLTASLLVAAGARADLAACIASNERALSLRRAGRLRYARLDLAACASPSCPDELRAECAKRMDALNEAMPSLVVGAKDVAGNDLTVAEVAIDGVAVATTLDGHPLDLDPGEHLVRVTAPRLPPGERKIVVGEGEKTRREAFVLGEPATRAAPPPVLTKDDAPHRSSGHTQTTLAFVSGALGVVGIGVGSAFGALASSKWSSSKNATASQASCESAASCPAHATAVADHDTAVTDATVSTVAIGVGAALAVTGIVAWVTAPSHAVAPVTNARVRLVPDLGRSGGGFLMLGQF